MRALPLPAIIRDSQRELIELLGGRASPWIFEAPPAVVALLRPSRDPERPRPQQLALPLKRAARRVLLSLRHYTAAAKSSSESFAARRRGFFTIESGASPEVIAAKGVEKGRTSAQDVVIIDTAGRTQLDEEMMEEARRIKEAVKPRESILVVDSMTGQEASKVA